MAWQDEPATAALQRRTLAVLFAGQVLGGLGTGAGAGLGSLIAYEVTRDEALAGISRVVSALSVAVLAVPLASLALARGRRMALAAGWVLSALGAGVLVLAARLGSLPLLMLGMFCFGGGSASNLQARFAATDMAPASTRARTMSLVMWAGTFGSIVGPNLATPGRAVGATLGVPAVAGTYVLAGLAVAAAAALVAALLRPDPMRLAQQHGDSPRGRPRGATWQAMRAIWAGRGSRFALVVVVCNQMVMTGVMTLTPVHMANGGHGLGVVGLALSLHIAGMYAFSPLVGWFTDRVGPRAAIAVCLVLNLAAVATCWWADERVAGLMTGLFLLGVGWSFGMVAGSAMLVDEVGPVHRTAAQGGMDTAMNVGAAIAAGLAGVVLTLVGYRGLSIAAGVLLLPIAAGLLRRGGDRDDGLSTGGPEGPAGATGPTVSCAADGR